MESKIPVNPAILRWAREDAGISLEDAAALAKISAIKATSKTPALTPAERLQKIESGETSITATVFSALARIYRRPEITFFLPLPPRKEKLLADFRTLNSHIPYKDSPEFSALKRYIINLHKGLKDIVAENGGEPIPFVGSVSSNASVASVVARVHEILGEDPRRNSVRNEDDFFNKLRERIQDAGVYVILAGNLGSHHSSVSMEEFRGICVADTVAPLIVINPNDTLRARIFSLLHEFCHVLLGISGIFNDAGVTAVTHGKAHEKLCNAVAAEYLVPAVQQVSLAESEISDIKIKELAKKFHVSEFVISRRLLDLNKITKEEYERLTNIYISKARQAKVHSGKTGGPSANIIARSYLGNKLIQTVWGAAASGQIAFTDASTLLGISVSRLDKVCV